jgi:hypothetical protein
LKPPEANTNSIGLPPFVFFNFPKPQANDSGLTALIQIKTTIANTNPIGLAPFVFFNFPKPQASLGFGKLKNPMLPHRICA